MSGKRALIVVDIQNDFLPGGALAVPRGDEVIAVANRAIGSGRFDELVATRDFHPPGHRSFASSHPGRQVGEVIDLDGFAQVLWPDHCVQGSPGSELAAGLSVERLGRVFLKGTDPAIDSYSGFFDSAHRKATGLHAWLGERGVDEVWLLGLATDYCVRATALDARGLGLSTVLLVDGCRAVELAPGDGERALLAMREAGVELADSSRL